MAIETIPQSLGGTRSRFRLDRILGRDWKVALIFIGPMAILMLGLIAWPFISAVGLSFFRVVGIRNNGFVGLDNYIDVWTDPLFQESIKVTTTFTFFSILFKFILGLTAATLLNRPLRFRNILTALILLPWIIPEVVTAMTWRSLYDPVFGGINQFLIITGLSEKGLPWLSDWALASVTIVNIWKGVPFFTITLLAGMKAIDPELYDAAAVDGANGWQRFINITLPSIRYVIIVATLLSTIWTFNAFGLVFLITSGGPGDATLLYSLLAYREAFGALRYSMGVAIALSMAPVLALGIFVLGRYMMAGQNRDEVENKGSIGAIIAKPFALVFGLILKVLLLINDLVEQAVSAIGRLIFRGSSGTQHAQKRIGSILTFIVLTLLVLFEMMPFYWVFITAFKSELQIQRTESIFWPNPWTMQNFTELLTQSDFLIWMRNTVTVALVSTLISVVVSALGAYALTRLRWRGQHVFSNAILIAYLMPAALMFIPLYQIVTQLHLINTLGALMITYPTFGLPFAAWLLMGYYRSIPEELEEAAMIDGCTRLTAFFRIVLPLITPALLAVALFSITGAWNEFLFAFTMINSNDMQTLPVGLARMIIGDVFPWGRLMAAALLTAIPVVILYASAQKFMIEGMTAGSVKG